MKTYSMRKKVRLGFVVAAIVLGICLLWFGIDAYVHPNTTYLPVSEKTGYIFRKWTMVQENKKEKNVVCA
jgi:hypothetical protein